MYYTIYSNVCIVFLEWKKIIRSDAALRIQALGRGYLCRKLLIKNDKNGRLTTLIQKNSGLHKKMTMVYPNIMEGVEVRAIFFFDFF